MTTAISTDIEVLGETNGHFRYRELDTGDVFMFCDRCGERAYREECGFICATPTCHDHHIGLARCYCGWAADGGDGYAQLEAMGETIEDY